MFDVTNEHRNAGKYGNIVALIRLCIVYSQGDGIYQVGPVNCFSSFCFSADLADIAGARSAKKPFSCELCAARAYIDKIPYLL